MKQLLSVLVLVLMVSCEGGGESGESGASVSNSGAEFIAETFTSDYYGVYSSGCLVGGSASSIADDVILTLDISASGIELKEEIFVGGGMGCMPANLITTLTHDINGDIETVQLENSPGVFTSEIRFNIEVVDTIFKMEHVVFDNYDCGGVIIDNVGDSEYLPANGCEYSRTGDEYSFKFEDVGAMRLSGLGGMNIDFLNSNSVDFN